MLKIYYLNECYHSEELLKRIKKELKDVDISIFECSDNSNIEISDSVPISYTSYPKVLFTHKNNDIFIGGNNEFQSLMDIRNKLMKDSTTKIATQKFITKYQTCLILTKLTQY